MYLQICTCKKNVEWIKKSKSYLEITCLGRSICRKYHTFQSLWKAPTFHLSGKMHCNLTSCWTGLVFESELHIISQQHISNKSSFKWLLLISATCHCRSNTGITAKLPLHVDITNEELTKGFSYSSLHRAPQWILWQYCRKNLFHHQESLEAEVLWHLYVDIKILVCAWFLKHHSDDCSLSVLTMVATYLCGTCLKSVCPLHLWFISLWCQEAVLNIGSSSVTSVL